MPDTLAAGSTVTISFKVENVGNRATREDQWTDRVYLSLDASLDDGDWLMSRESAPGVIVKAENKHVGRSEEHTSELQSLMRISYAVFCLKKKKTNKY